jgi:formylmethanofuran:tetrahydromethanopterin formyltransferase
MGREMAHIPSVADGLLHGTTADAATGLAVGSPAWFAWLADDAARSFSFRSPAVVDAKREGQGVVVGVEGAVAASAQHEAVQACRVPGGA